MRNLALAFVCSLALAPAAWAKYTGLSLSTTYPEQTVQAGQTTTVPLTVHNYGLDPQPVALSAIAVAHGWKAEFEGGARAVGSVFVDSDEQRNVSLRLTPPADAGSGSYDFTVRAQGADHRSELHLVLHVAKTLPDWLTVTSALPQLKGSPSTQFSYDLVLHNESGHDVQVALAADAPRNFQVDFTPQYGSQSVTSVEVKSGSTKDVTAKVKLPGGTPAGRYDLTVHAASGDTKTQLPLAMVVSGTPDLSISTPDGRLSGDAYVDKDSAIALTVSNMGSAPAQDVKLSADPPSHWKVSFHPEKIPVIGPGQTVKVSADMTPSHQSLAGDYMVTFNADGGPSRTRADYRVTVMTSTLWGAAGIAIALAAILVVGFAVMRFGRR